jgi:site-specific recombinase XerD
MTSSDNTEVRGGLTISEEMQAFLTDCGARNLSPNTVRGYGDELGRWAAWQAEQDVAAIAGITPGALRRWMLRLGETRAPGGVHVNYRAVKTFLRWVWREHELEARNPIARLQPPRLPKELLQPVALDDLRAMLRVCEATTLEGARDQAMFMTLLDTGCRASEFVTLNIGDVNLRSGRVLVRQGKGAKSRIVFVGKRTRHTIGRYLRQRDAYGEADPLWVDAAGKRFSAGHLRDVLHRRAAAAGVAAPTPHSFRRGFALISLRNGMDIYSLQRLMGHSDLTVLRRYLKQTDIDLQEAHRKSGPVDNLM